MLGYFFRKLAALLVSLCVIVTITFFLMRWLPGDPFGEEKMLPHDVHLALLHHYGLDQSTALQYRDFLFRLIDGDLGESIKYPGRSVLSVIKEGFPVSAQIGLQAFILSIAFGIGFGSLSALRADFWQDRFLIFITTISISVPSFIVAALLQYCFSIYFPLFPVARSGSFIHTVLPTLALAAAPLAFIMRLVRATLMDVLQSDFVKLSLAKGLPMRRWFIFTALPSGVLPLFSYLGPLLANVLIGSFIVEKVFSIPGLGTWFVESVSSRDYPLVMGLTLFYSFVLLTAVFLFDILYALFDPRVRLIGRY